MPFAALCKKCGSFLINTKLILIANDILEHFKSHESFPAIHPFFLNYFEDFETYNGYFERETFDLRTITIGFQYRRFDSDEYSITVIMNRDFDDATLILKSSRSYEDKQKALAALLSDYFE